MRNILSRRKAVPNIEASQPDYIGMRLKNLDERTLRDIGLIYLRTVYNEDYPEEFIEGKLGGLTVRNVTEQLESGFAEFRLGSRITMHSKLHVKRAGKGVIRFDFYGNAYQERQYDPSIGEQEKEIDADFKTGNEKYLTERRIAVPIFRSY